MGSRLSEWIRFGIETEEKGIRLYRQCLAKVKHPQGAELFDYLVRAEQGHRKVLKALLDSVEKGDRKKIKEDIDDFMGTRLKNPMFREDEVGKLTGKGTTLREMFNKAAAFEDEGIRLYSDIAAKEKDPEIRKLFRRLISDEKVHKEEIRKLGFFVFDVPVSPQDLA